MMIDYLFQGMGSNKGIDTKSKQSKICVCVDTSRVYFWNIYLGQEGEAGDKDRGQTM